MSGVPGTCAALAFTTDERPHRSGPSPVERATGRELRALARVINVEAPKNRTSCTLSARRLNPGSYSLTASCGGSTYYTGTSATKTLKVTG
jgi:hypothetical protein